MTHKEKAMKIFYEKFNCSQAVLGAYADGPDYKATAYPKAAEFMDRFKEKNASYVCREMLGCDISSEEGMLYARENGLFKDICPKMVESAVDILEEMEMLT